MLFILEKLFSIAENIGLDAGVKRSVTNGSSYISFRIKSHLCANAIKEVNNHYYPIDYLK